MGVHWKVGSVALRRAKDHRPRSLPSCLWEIFLIPQELSVGSVVLGEVRVGRPSHHSSQNGIITNTLLMVVVLGIVTGLVHWTTRLSRSEIKADINHFLELSHFFRRRGRAWNLCCMASFGSARTRARISGLIIWNKWLVLSTEQPVNAIRQLANLVWWIFPVIPIYKIKGLD